MLNNQDHPVTTTPQTLQKLQAAGVLNQQIDPLKLQGFGQTNQDTHNSTPWFLQIILGISGLLAGVLLVIFLVLLLFNSFNESPLSLVIGATLLGSSAAMFNLASSKGQLSKEQLANASISKEPPTKAESSSQNTFLTSLAFSLSMAGQIFVTAGLVMADTYEPIIAGLMMLLQLALLALLPNFLHRLFSSFFALSCMIWLLSYYHAPEVGAGLLALITSVCLLQRYELASFAPAKRAHTVLALSQIMGYASAFILLLISVYFISAEYGHDIIRYSEGYDSFYYYHYPLAQGLLLLASLYAVHLILRRYQMTLLLPAGLVIITAISVMAVISVYVSGLLAASLVIVIAIANAQRILAALGVSALVGYVFWYYYQLDTSLLIKSASMLAVAIGLLLIRWLVVKTYFAQPVNQSTNDQKINNGSDTNQREVH